MKQFQPYELIKMESRGNFTLQIQTPQVHTAGIEACGLQSSDAREAVTDSDRVYRVWGGVLELQ